MQRDLASRRELRAHVLDNPGALVRQARKAHVAVIELTFRPSQQPLFERRRALLEAVLSRRKQILPREVDDELGPITTPKLGLGPVLTARWSGVPTRLDAAILRRQHDAFELLRAHATSREEAAAAVRRVRNRVPSSFLRGNEWLEEAALCAVAEALRDDDRAQLFLGARALVEGRVNEIDVLVRREGRAVAIECKAFRNASGGLVSFGHKLVRMRVPPTAADLAQHTADIVRVAGLIPAIRALSGRPVSPLVSSGFEPFAKVVGGLDELAQVVRSALG